MANNEPKVLTTNSFEDWRKKSNEVSYHLGDIHLLDARVGDKTYTYSASANQGIFVSGDSAGKILRFELASEAPIDSPATIIFTGTPTIASNWVAGNTVYQGSVGSETFTGNILYVNTNKVALQNTTGTFSASTDLTQTTVSTHQTIANANLVRIVSEAYDTGYVKTFDTNVEQPQTLTQVGFHVPNLAFTITLTGSPAVLATFSEGATVYQGSVGSETFTGTILNTTTGFVYLKTYTGTFNASVLLKQSEGAGDRILAANLTSGAAVDASFGTIVELHTLAGASDAIKVISTNTIDALGELQGDIGTVESLTTTSTDLQTAINEHDAELGTITAAAMGTTASTVSTAINEHETQIGGPSTFDIDTTANTLVGALNEHEDDLYTSTTASFTGLTAKHFKGAILETIAEVGDHTTLTTAHTATLVGAINEVESVFDASTHEISAGSNAFTVTSGAFTLDSSGDIYLDADGGDIDFRDAGATFGRITNSSLDLVLSAYQDDKDIIFRGVDDGSTITALTLDMSDAGAATFTNDVNVGVNLDVTGTGTIDGNFAVGADKFNVIASSGNTQIDGTLDVDSNFEVGASKFNVTAATGNTQIDGTLDVDGTGTIDGNFAVGADKFNVTAATGNTQIDGTLEVDGTLGVDGNSALVGTLTVTGATALNGGLTLDTNKFTVADTTGNTVIDGTLTVNGIVDVGQLNTKFSNRNNVKLALNELHDELGVVADIDNATGYAATTAVTGVTEIQGKIGEVTAVNMGTTASTLVTAIKEHDDHIGAMAWTGTGTTIGGTSYSITTALNALDAEFGDTDSYNDGIYGATTVAGTLDLLQAGVIANDAEILTLNTFVEPSQALNVGASTLADAVNELEADLFNAEGGTKRTLASLITTDQTSIVDAINENHTEIGVLGNLDALISGDTNLVTAVNELQSDIGDVATINNNTGYAGVSASAGIIEIQADLGNVTAGNMGTTASTVVGAISEHETQINSNDAEILTLNTFVEPAQTLNVGSATLADAINELEADLYNVEGGDKRTLSSLTTTDKTSIVDAINEVQGEINSNDTDIAARLIKDTGSTQTLTGPITYGDGSTSRTFTFAGATTLDISNATVLYSAAGGIQSSGSAFLNLDATAQSGSNVALQGLQVDRTAISGGAATHDVRLQWNEGRVSADPEEAWELVGMNTSGTTETSSVLTRYNAFNLFANNLESGIDVTWDGTNKNFDINVDDFDITLTGDVTGSGTVTNLANVSFATTIQPNSVALTTDTTGDYVATIGGTSLEVEVTGSGTEGRAVTVGLPSDVTIGNDLTVTRNLQVNGDTTLGNQTSDTVATLGNLTVGGNLTVDGTQTILNTETLEVEDTLVLAGSALTAEPASGGFGIETGPQITQTVNGAVSSSTAVTLDSGTGVVVGQGVYGTGVAAGALVSAISGVSLTLSIASTIANDATLTFSHPTKAANVTGVHSIVYNYLEDRWEADGSLILSSATFDSASINGTTFSTDKNLTFSGSSGVSMAAAGFSGTEWTLGFTNTDRGSSQNIFKTFTADSGGSAVANSNTDTLSLAGGGAITTTRSGDEIEISHDDTSSQASVNTSGGIVIQDVTLDTYGHVTGLASTDLDARFDDYGYWSLKDHDGTTYTLTSQDILHVKEDGLLDVNFTADDELTIKTIPVATNRIIGRSTAGTGEMEVLTATQVRTMLNVANGATNFTYTHPSYTARDASKDSGPHSGATVFNDIDFNLETDGFGHVTVGEWATLTTREMTLADLSYTGDPDANKYTHPTYTVRDLDFDGAEVVDLFDSNAGGHVTNITKRTLTLADLGYTGTSNANTYSHPTHPSDDLGVDTGALTGAWVISDLDINVDSDSEGHVTDANGTYAKRELTLGDLGYPGDYNWLIEASGTNGTDDIGDNTIVKFTGAGATTVTRSGQEIIITSTDTDTGDTGDTRYTHDFIDSSADAVLRLQGSGASTGSSDVKFVAGDYITLTPSGDNLTIDVNQQASWTANDQLTTEEVQDIVGLMVSGNTETGISVDYQDADGTLDFAVTALSRGGSHDTTYDLYASGSTDPYLNLDAVAGDDDAVQFVGSGDLVVTRVNNEKIQFATTHPTIGDASITIEAGSGLTGGAAFTTNQTSNENIALNVGAGTHITVNANDIAVQTATGNVANKIVQRDGSGNFAANTITAGLTGNASSATGVKVTRRTTEDVNYHLIGVAADIGGDSKALQGADEFYWNTNSNTLFSTNFSGNGWNLTSLNMANATGGILAIARGGTGTSTGHMLSTSEAYIHNTDDNASHPVLFTETGNTAGNAKIYKDDALNFYYNASTNIVYATDMVASSDERQKDIIEPITGALDKVCAIDGFIYKWNDKAESDDTETRQAGISAQAVQAVLPEAVFEKDGGYLGVAYDKLVPLLIEAVKELKSDNEELRASIEELKSYK